MTRCNLSCGAHLRCYLPNFKTSWVFFWFFLYYVLIHNIIEFKEGALPFFSWLYILKICKAVSSIYEPTHFYIYVIGIVKDKERKLEDEMAGPRPSHCAFLGSLLWERTLPYNEIEYVDLDEFLLENGLPSTPPHQPFSPANLTPPPSNQSVVDLSRPASCASSTSACSSPGQSMTGSEFEHPNGKTGTTN